MKLLLLFLNIFVKKEKIVRQFLDMCIYYISKIISLTENFTSGIFPGGKMFEFFPKFGRIFRKTTEHFKEIPKKNEWIQNNSEKMLNVL